MDRNKERKLQQIEKLGHLHNALQDMDKVAVAYSGGVDSSFLLHSACSALEAGKVVAFHAVSSLTGRLQREKAQKIFHKAFIGRAEYREIVVYPLSWTDFTANTDKRCYFCKSRLYQIFIEEMKDVQCRVLLDGTNADDLEQNRPGLRAIRELGVRTPLADAGLGKEEIRVLAQNAGLPNYDSPANSCLATRIATGREITSSLLERIEKAENFLERSGFLGTRVRPFGEFTHIDILSEDMERFCLSGNRQTIQDFFTESGLGNAFLNIAGR